MHAHAHVHVLRCRSVRLRCPRMTQVRAAWSDVVKELCPELGNCAPSYRALSRARLLSARVWRLSWAAQVSRKEAPGHYRCPATAPLPRVRELAASYVANSIAFVWTTRPQQAGGGVARELLQDVQGVLHASVAALPGSVLGRVPREGLQVAGGLWALCGQRQSLWIVHYQRGALNPHVRRHGSPAHWG